MASEPVPQPLQNIPIVDTDLRLSLAWRQYFPKLDAAVRGLVAMVSGQFTSSVPLIAVGTPTNANAAAAGVAIGQLYTDAANPANVYIRTA
jgi:hypothetical protein